MKPAAPPAVKPAASPPAAAPASTPAAKQQPAANSLTPPQRAKLKERDRLWQQAIRLRDSGKIDEAIAAAQKMLAIEREVLGNDHYQVAVSLAFLAALLETREDFPAARKARDETLAITTKEFGKDHWHAVDSRLALDNLSLLEKLDHDQRRQLDEATKLNAKVIKLLNSGKYADALLPAQQALETRQKILGEKHPFYAISLNNLAVTYEDLDKSAQAEPLYLQSVEIRKQVYGEKHPDYAIGLISLGNLYRGLGKYTKSEPLYLEALEIRKQALGEINVDTIATLNNLAVLYSKMGTPEKAVPIDQHLVKNRKEIVGEKHPE